MLPVKLKKKNLTVWSVVWQHQVTLKSLLAVSQPPISLPTGNELSLIWLSWNQFEMEGFLLLLRFKWPVGHTRFCLVIFFFWLYCVTLGILVPWPEVEPGTLTVRVQSPSHWPTGEFPALGFLNVNILELAVPVIASCIRFNPVHRTARWHQGTLPSAFYFEIFQTQKLKRTVPW